MVKILYIYKMVKIQQKNVYILHSCDHLKKISIKINVATDEGNSRNEIGQ